MKTKALDFLSFLIALATTVLAVADTQQPMAIISPEIAAKWPIFMGAALLVSRIARLIGDWLDDGKLNDSFRAGVTTLIMVVALCFLTGCVNGRPVPWLTAQGCYTLKDGTRACAGVSGGNVAISVEAGATQGYAK